MPRLMVLVGTFLMALMCAYPIYAAERRVALVIGNANYQYINALKNPVNDAQDMKKVLEELQFQVILKTNANLRTMVDAINAQDVLDKMDQAKTHLNLVFLDACRNNPFPRSVRAASRGLAGMNAPTGTLLVFATNPNNVAQDGAERNGIYTKHLLQYIKQPELEVGIMLRKVRTAVKEETGGQQVPWENGAIEGEFYFNDRRGVPPAAVATPPMSSSPPPQALNSLPPAPAPAASGTTGGSTVDISGVWREIYPNPGTISQTTQDGNTFQFTIRGNVQGVPFQSAGRGTIRGRHIESTYQSTLPSKGSCSGTLSADGMQITSTCTDSVYGRFEMSGMRQ
jgi:hypothetical protein